MADSKIDFSFENLHFACEGDNDWVEKQLNNVLNRIPALLTVHKKSESIVEEVIEVAEEVTKEEASGKPRKESRVDAPKSDKIPTGKRQREKKPKTDILIEAADNEPGNEVVPPRRGRKPKLAVAKAGKGKKGKKTTEKKSPEQPDSPIAQFIAEKKATGNQVRKFLATAVFLARNNNVSKLSTPMISRALKSYGIEKLQNASDCLNKNEKKGYCIKEGKEFIITENGYLSIG